MVWEDGAGYLPAPPTRFDLAILKSSRILDVSGLRTMISLQQGEESMSELDTIMTTESPNTRESLVRDLRHLGL